MKIKKIGKILLWIIAVLVGLMIIVPALLYVPFIQDGVKNIAVAQVAKATGWEMQVDAIRLDFPLGVRVEGVGIIDQGGDTIIAARRLVTGVEVGPLLRGRVKVGRVRLDEAIYGMKSEGSSMVLKARVRRVGIDGVDYDLARSELNVEDATLQGGDVVLNMYPDRAQPSPPTDTTATAFTINVGRVALDDVRYTMAMLPTIDSLGVVIGRASLDQAMIDLASQRITAGSLAVDSLVGSYYTPSLEYLAAHPVVTDSIATDEAAEPSRPWEIRCNAVRLTRAGGTYAVRGWEPVEGLDMSHLQASNINLSIDSLYNCGTAITVPITLFNADERSGLRITEGHGTFAMDDAGMTLRDFNLSTLLSSLQADAYIDNSFLAGDPDGQVRLDANLAVGLAEVSRAMPDLAPVLAMIPQNRPLEGKIGIAGTARRLTVDECHFSLPRYASVAVGGTVDYPMDVDRLGLDLTLNGNFENINFVKSQMLDAGQHESVHFPPLKLDGDVWMQGEEIDGGLTLTLPTGATSLDASWRGRTTDYDLALQAGSLPLHALLPLSDLGLLTANVAVQGHGIDPYDAATFINARIDIATLEYGPMNYQGIKAIATLRDNQYNLNLASDNEALRADMALRGTLHPDAYSAWIDADIDRLDIQRMGLSPTALNGRLSINGNAAIDLKQQSYDAKLGVTGLGVTIDEEYYYADAINLDFASDTLHTAGSLTNGDLSVTLAAPLGVERLIDGFVQTGALAAEQVERIFIDADTLRTVLPEFDCDIAVGRKNLAAQFLESSGVTFRDMQYCIKKDSTFRMTGDIDRLTASGITIDTVKMYATERNRRLSYALRAANRDNRNGTGIATAGLLGIVAGNRATVLMRQTNFNDSIGVRFGIDATLDTTRVLLKLIPEDPIIGYKRWYVNDSNHISYNYLANRFEADMRLQCDSSLVSLTTQPSDEGGQDDILLNVEKVQIADWLTFSPLAPPLRGVLGMELKVKYDGDNLWGDGAIDLNDFYYAKKRVGDFTINSLIDIDPLTGGTNITAALEVDHRQALMAYGSINDSTTTNPYDMWIELDRLPLAIVNPFMPPSLLNTYGYLNGMMSVSGTLDAPLLNGYLQCDSTYVAVPAFSTNINLPSTHIPVDSSIVRFNDYSIKMLNDNPLVVNGTVDITNLADAGVNLALRGQNVQFVNSNQKRKAELFGRGYANLDATVQGTVSDLDVDATVSILSGTNITYVLPTDVNTLTQQQSSEGLVTFVQFSDSTTYVKMDSLQAPTTSNMNLRARLNIMQGSHINVYLTNNGTDRAEVEGNGNLTFVMNQLGDMTLTGRYTISDGYVRYNPPLISQVLFDIEEGSFIQFNGEIMNPVLNLNAVQTVKANVTQEGQNSRLIDFLISLGVTNTLNDMNVQFDLSTNGDVTVQNELQSMSETQRSNQAMNLLLYGTYTGPSTTASSNLASNQLYSFLQSKLNSWAASNIKGVDLSFGIDQYNQTRDGVSSSTMRYSYQVSKTLFNDRFKIVVGGNYSPDMTGDDEIAQSLFNDVSLEYALTESGSMYVRLFNKSGYESILEGEVTQTGVGFVISRKLPRLKYLFTFRRPKLQAAIKKEEELQPTDTTAVENKQ